MSSSYDIAWQIGRQFGQLIGVERGRRGQKLRRIHASDEAFTDRVGRLHQNVAVAIRLDQIPDEHALIERQRFKDVRDVGRMQLIKRGPQARENALHNGALRRIVESVSQAKREARKQPVLPYQRDNVA